MTDNTAVATIGGMSPELKAKLAKVDDGASADIRARLIMDGGDFVLKVGDDSREMGNKLDVIILGVSPVIREIRTSEYDPSNPTPPDSYQWEAKSGRLSNNPPMILSRETGKLEPDHGQAEGQVKWGALPIGGKASYKQHVVCVFPDNISESGLISFPVPSASIFHKGDVKNNPENRKGLMGYITQVKSLLTEDGESALMMQVLTNLEIHKGMKQGHAISFSFRDDDKSPINLTPVDQVEKCVDLINTKAYANCMEGYTAYLDSALKGDDEKDDVATKRSAPQVNENVDDMVEKK